jgi:hypothetical protein
MTFQLPFAALPLQLRQLHALKPLQIQLLLFQPLSTSAVRSDVGRVLQGVCGTAASVAAQAMHLCIGAAQQGLTAVSCRTLFLQAASKTLAALLQIGFSALQMTSLGLAGSHLAELHQLLQVSSAAKTPTFLLMLDPSRHPQTLTLKP